MSKLLIASNNRGKLDEIKRILGGLYTDIFTPADIGLELDVVEDGEIFLANAIKKAVAFMQASGMDALADDSGLCVEALGGLPGVRSARFAGEDHNDQANNALLLQRMQGQQNRAAKFVCCVVLAGTDGKIIYASGESRGRILEQPRGESGFGYDPLFYDEQLGKSYAELSMKEKNGISHRAKALHILVEKLGKDKE